MGFETDWLESRSRLTPNHIAIIDGHTGERWSYRQLNQRGRCLAGYLQKQGVAKGDRIALLSPNHISYFDMLFACGKLGAIFVPLNWRLSLPELSYMIHDSSPTMLAYHNQMEILINGLTVPKKLSVTGSDYDEIMQVNDESLQQPPVHFEDPYTIIYTGGTTGKSKGVVLTHRSIFWNGLNTVMSWQLTSNEVTLTYLPMFHTGGLNALSIPILQIGGTVIIGRDFEPVEAIELLNQEKCTITLMVPTMYHMMIHTPHFQETSFPSMHTFLSGGAPCPLTIYQAFEEKGLTFKEGYGLTEAGPNNFFMDPTQVSIKRGSVGKPMMFNQINIVRNDGTPTLTGEVGEVLIKGNHVFGYYWNNPEATKEAIIDNWLYTGDLGRVDEDGYHYIVGRKKDMIITGGENVYPLELEHLIGQHPAVHETVVVGIPDQKWGETVTAIVVLRKGITLTIEQLQDYCSTKIAKYKIPKKMIIVKELPQTPVGKIDKKTIVKMFA